MYLFLLIRSALTATAWLDITHCLDRKGPTVFPE